MSWHALITALAEELGPETAGRVERALIARLAVLRSSSLRVSELPVIGQTL